MPTYNYTAKSRSGERSSGTIEAPDRRGAMIRLERQGLIPVTMKEGTGGKAEKGSGKKGGKSSRGAKQQSGMPEISFGRKKTNMNMREVSMFTRELGDLLTSGMTLGNALNTLSRRKTNSAADRIVVDLRDQIIKGASLSEALSAYPDTFSNLFVSMVRAGEASGSVPEALERLGVHHERVLDAREKVMTAMTYPSIVLGAGVLTIVFVMTFVIPKFTKVFEDLGATLPLMTRILIGISSFVLTYGWMIAIGLVVGFIFFKRYVKTEKGMFWWHGRILKMPVVKKVVQANAFGQFARTLGALLTNGVPVLNALSIVENTITNKVISREIHDARERVTDGSTIAGPLAAGKVFPPLLTDMLAIGEESGDMAGALGHIADRYDAELDRSVKVLTTVLEPVMIVLIAIAVGFVAISMLMAVFSMTSGLAV